MTPREAMVDALKPALNAYLRSRGFKGSFPHFRQVGDEQIRLITFQFKSSGGSIVVEIVDRGPAGITDRYDEVHKPPGKPTAHDVFSPRPRLATDPNSRGDNWFRFGPPNCEPDSDVVSSDGRYEAIAQEVIRLLGFEAEPFGSGNSLSVAPDENPHAIDPLAHAAMSSIVPISVHAAAAAPRVVLQCGPYRRRRAVTRAPSRTTTRARTASSTTPTSNMSEGYS